MIGALMPKVVEILDGLKTSPKVELTDNIRTSLAAIKQICDKDFSNQKYYGNAALNRKMLLNQDIAKHLTPDVIGYLFTNEPTPETKIARNTSRGGEINLRDAIYYGFNDGLQVIELMLNNEAEYGSAAYIEQKENFSKNTKLIIANIEQAAGGGIQAEEDRQSVEPSNLVGQYEHVVNSINIIKAAGRSAELLHVPGYSLEQMQWQARHGMDCLCKIILKEDKLEDITLNEFCERFLQSEEAMLDGTVSHALYDRAHIDAALQQDTTYNIGGIDYNFQDIFRVLVSKVAQSPDKYPPCAKEQFCLRFGLVDSDLQIRFKTEHEMGAKKTTDTQINVAELKVIVSEYKEHLANEVKKEGFSIASGAIQPTAEDITTYQQKLINRYNAINELSNIIQGKNSLNATEIKEAKHAVKTCLNNKPEWSERPFLQKLTDGLSLGFKALYRAFYSTESIAEKQIEQVLSGPKMR